MGHDDRCVWNRPPVVKWINMAGQTSQWTMHESHCESAESLGLRALDTTSKRFMNYKSDAAEAQPDDDACQLEQNSYTYLPCWSVILQTNSAYVGVIGTCNHLFHHPLIAWTTQAFQQPPSPSAKGWRETKLLCDPRGSCDLYTPIIQYPCQLCRSRSTGNLVGFLWNVIQSISIKCTSWGNSKDLHRWTTMAQNLLLAFYVNAVTPFQIQLSQVKYTHPPRDLLLSLPNGRRGDGMREKERDPKPSESLLTKWPESNNGNYSTAMHSFLKESVFTVQHAVSHPPSSYWSSASENGKTGARRRIKCCSDVNNQMLNIRR